MIFYQMKECLVLVLARAGPVSSQPFDGESKPKFPISWGGGGGGQGEGEGEGKMFLTLWDIWWEIGLN